ncbi:hypothetical protein BROC_01269 [Candidatus Brocadiaceae bacterium]|nr:hypothetical protein BROC_01269 [Candidatus Brocadiaceae bacterium]
MGLSKAILNESDSPREVSLSFAFPSLLGKELIWNKKTGEEKDF